MSQLLYFAYGSNLDPEQMTSRCPSARGLGRARLRDHRLDFTYFSMRWSGGSADVVPHSGDNVWGALYELEPADLARLDRFEGGYQRVFLSVLDEAGCSRNVVSYDVRVKRSFRPTASYVQKMLFWGEHWDLPESYLAQLRLTPVLG